MKHLALLFSTLFCLLFNGFSHLSAQRYTSVLSKPRVYDPPAISEGREKKAEDQKALEGAGAPYTRDSWIVVSDRDDNQTYDELGKDAKPLKTINFRDWFYVVAEQGRWIHICKAEVIGGKNIVSGTFEDYGWVEKFKMLLWNSSIIDPNTKIHKKAFLLNRAEDIVEVVRSKDETVVDIFHDPNTGTPTEDPKTIYEFYFVYKYENDRYLLGKDDQFSTRGMESLVGWVLEKKCVTWNTRIALEPNFEEAAFEERKNNKEYRIFGYKGMVSADQQSKTGEVNEGDVYWDDDPVNLDPGKMAKTNPRRFNGNVMRFPLLSCSERYVRSGVIGEVTYKTLSGELEQLDEVYYSKILATFRAEEEGRFSYDILIAVEATPSLKDYQQAIIDGVNLMRVQLVDVENLRWGLVLYRDIPEEGSGRMCVVKRFTQNVDEFIQYLKSAEFGQWEDTDPWTTLFYGLKEGILDAGVDDNHTNILLVVGSNGAFRRNTPRFEKDQGHKACVSPAQVVDHLANAHFNFAVIQCQNIETAEQCTEVFQDQIRNLILKTAVLEYGKFKNAELAGIDIPPPTISDMDGLTEDLVKMGSSFAYIRKPAAYGNLKPEEVTAAMGEAARSIIKRKEEVYRQLRRIVEEGGSFENVSTGDFKEGMLGIFSGLLQGGKITREDLAKINRKKYRLYAEVFFPTQIAGAKYPAFSPVLFMPEDDLRRYLDVLKQLRSAADKSADVQREYLYSTLIDLAGQYSGSNTGKENTVDDLRNLMQGVQSETCGMFTAKWTSLKIGDIKDRKKMPDNAVSTWVNEILYKTKDLQKIANDRNYEFKYVTANNTYYWIPLEYMF